MEKLLRKIPKMDELLELDIIIDKVENGSRNMILESLREATQIVRENIINKKIEDFDNDYIVKMALNIYDEKMEMRLKPVVNATGTVLHTNLGRSILSKSACEAVNNVNSHYSNLEYDIKKGRRGERYDAVTGIINKLTGAEASLVVNNNAAAVLLALSALAKEKDVIVSRGEQVEIGGKFRVPEIMEQSGSYLVEVGTTNKTHLDDYERKINENSVLLKVHTSNFKLIGFTEEVAIEELVKLGKENNIPVIYDLGSGALIDFDDYGIYGEPNIKKSVESGADIICFSGDKLLGGPQAGIIIGKKEYIDIMKAHPLTRAFRVDKMTIAALEATLREYLDEETAVKNIPVLNQILSDNNGLKLKAEKLYSIIEKDENMEIKIEEIEGQVGGGSMPGLTLKSWGISLKHNSISLNEYEKKLREFKTPIIIRIYNDTIIFDVLTTKEEEFEYINQCIKNINTGV